MSSEGRGGRNNKYNANKCIAMHDMASSGARGALTRYEVIPVKGENIWESIPGVSRFWTNETGGGKLCVHYARDAWWTNGLRIRVRLVVLSNFMYKVFPSELRFILYEFSKF